MAINLWGASFILIVLNYMLYRVLQSWRRYVVSFFAWCAVQVIDSISMTKRLVIGMAVYRCRLGFLANGH